MRTVNAILESLRSIWRPARFETLRDDQQQLLVATDLNVPPDWEFNFGVGVGATSSTDHLIVKAIVGRRFSWPSRPFPSDTSKGDVREKDKPKK